MEPSELSNGAPLGRSASAERKLCWASLRRHSYDQALQHLELALQSQPNNGDFIWSRGICYDLLGKQDLACKDYSEYLQTRDFKETHDNFRYREAALFKKFCRDDYFAAIACGGYSATWPQESMPLKVYIPTDGQRGFTPSAKAEIFNCLDQWCEAAAGKISYRVVDSDADAVVSFRRVSSNYELDDSGTYDGMTHPQIDSPNGWGMRRMRSANIRLVDFDTRTMTPEKANRIHGLFLHEIGHALGLRTHSPNAGDVMFLTNLVSQLSRRDCNNTQAL